MTDESPSAQPEEKPADAPVTEKTEEQKAEYRRKMIAEEAFKAREAVREAKQETAKLEAQKAALEAMLSAKGGQTSESVAALNEEQILKAAHKLREQESRMATEKSFADQCNSVWNKALAANSDFEDAYKETFLLGDQPPPRDFLETILELDKPEQILYDLAKNPEEAHRIMSLSPAKRAVELARLENKETPAKPVSKVSPPIKTVESKRPSAAATDILDPNTDINTWMKNREEQKLAKMGLTRRR